MKIVPISGKRFLDLDTGFSLNGRPVGVAQALVVITEEERNRLISASQLLWKGLKSQSSYAQEFVGAVRFDLVPKFPLKSAVADWSETYDLGPMYIKGVFELNAHGIECAAADKAMREQVPAMVDKRPDATVALARAIQDTFGGQEIAFVTGDGPVKKAWKQPLLRGLLEAGVNLQPMGIREVVEKRPSVIYRFGDAREQGYTEFPDWFTKFLREYDGAVFNTVPLDGEDVSSKALLMPCGVPKPEWDSIVGKNRLLNTEEDIAWGAANQNNLVCKPVRGASGRDVFLGRLMRPEDWKQTLSENRASGGFGLYEARWLPRVTLPGIGEFALDINPAFWIEEGKLSKCLYAVVRIDRWERYWSRGTINVAQGAGYAGTVIEKG